MSAQQVLQALGSSARRVEVVGEGKLAEEVRLLLGAALQQDPAAAPPTGVVVATGDPAAVAAALVRVDDLGTVVLAGAAPREPAVLDLYGDLHVRGLVLVGVPSAG